MNEQRLLNSSGKMLATRWFRWYSPEKFAVLQVIAHTGEIGKEKENASIVETSSTLSVSLLRLLTATWRIRVK